MVPYLPVHFRAVLPFVSIPPLVPFLSIPPLAPQWASASQLLSPTNDEIIMVF